MNIADWFNIDQIPPDELVEVIDKDENTAFAIPTYYPFEVVKMDGDDRKAWGWRGTPVFYEDNKSKWDGGWMIQWVGFNPRIIGNIIGWRLIEHNV
jgi:hypothetical protein